MENEVVLVLGANGKTGARVANKLERLNIRVRRGSRREQPAFSWDDSRQWDEVLDGIDSVYITYQPDLAIPGTTQIMASFVQHCRKQGIRRLVLLSGRGEPEALACEKVVEGSGLVTTIVRSSFFNQNFSESFMLEPILAREVFLPAGDVKEPFIDVEDIADVVVAALTEEGHGGKVYEVTGPRLLTFREAIQEISAATKSAIAYHQVPVEAYAGEMRKQGVPDDVVNLIAFLFTEVLDGRNESIAHGVEHALGRKPRDFSEYVSRTVTTGAWAGNNVV